jgi:thiol-disulfide isomerase/thioredoxin
MNAFLAAPGADPATASEARNIIANPVRARTPFAPGFSFTSLENEKISSEALRGKVVLLDFWATWCPPCRASIPSIKGLQGKYAGKQVQIISISSDSDEQAWRSFVAAQHMNWTEYIDLPRNIQNAFGVDSLPTYVVIDKDGVVRFRQSGFGNETPGEIEEAINKALKRDPDAKLAAAASGASPAATSGFAASAAEPNPAATTVVREAGTQMVAAHTTAIPAQTLGTQSAKIAGNVYTNDDLKLTYSFPQGWIGKVPEAASASGAARVIFYASRNGAGSAEQPDLSSIRIAVLPTGADGLSMESFQKATSALVASSGMTVAGPPAEISIKKRKFLRADLLRSVGAIRLYQSTLQAQMEGAVLTIDIFAVSADELQRITDSLQSISIGTGAQ